MMRIATMMFTGGLLGALTSWASPGLEGSKHDFSGKEWSSGSSCAACHTPHQENPPEAAPLWDADADLSSRFGSSLGAGRPDGQGTLMCLRCHDGTIAKDTIGGVTRQPFAHSQRPVFSTAAHGATDHPVGVAYPKNDKGYHPMNVVVAKGTVLIPNGFVQCSSCHDPHNSSGEKYMLVTSNARSGLCLTCHNK